MIFERYLQKPLVLVLGLWMAFFVATRFKYAMQGYNESSEKFPARWRGHQQCMNDPGHRIAFPIDCGNLDSISYFSPYWDGLDNAWRNTYFCGVVECSAIFDHLTKSVESLGIVFAAGSVVAIVCGAFLYVILSRTIQLGYAEKRQLAPAPLQEYGQIPMHAWRHFNQLLQSHALLENPPLTELPQQSKNNRRLTFQVPEEEVDH